MRVLPYGDQALLVELDPELDPLGLLAAVRAAALPGVGELVPAARTLLIRFDPGEVTAAGLRAAVAELIPQAAEGATAPPVVLPVVYDGADLDAVGQRTGLTVAEVVARHCAATYTVAFCGFAPGFAYLRGLDPVLQLPRLESPRTSVPAGSVAIAAEYTAVYPRASPGGWLLLGRTDARLWDLDRTPPARLTPGTPVRFRPA